MTKLKFNDLISLLRENYSGNKSYYESLFSILYFTDEDFVLEDFLKRRTKFRKEKNESKLKQSIINHDNYVYTMNVFKDIFGKEFIKSKPLSFLDAFIVCCGDKTTTSSTDVKKILRKKLLTDFDTKELYKKYEYRFRSGFTRKKVRVFLENYNKPLEREDDPLFIRFLCDYFNMNICIILPKENDILFYSPRDKFSIYCPTMILEKFKDNQYQYLIMSNKETVFTSSSSFIYKLLNYKIMKDYIKYVENNEIHIKKKPQKSVNSHFIEENQKIEISKNKRRINNEEIIEEEQKIEITKNKDRVNNEEIIKEVPIVQNDDIKRKKYNKTTLNKLKLKELQEIALKYNINIQKLKVGKNKGFKNKTKKELISEIVNQ